ncbi:hypothetical protein M3D53_01150 [Dermabacter hominis]|uniref:hypothetical protein n=1 Tax=Dermabacter hominis TaxID=36740 RepID=UPI0021A43CB0|nr:hypothetical protein [Dermabacter hominis]MCT2056467.1 hypothetical protein [Dermabacter hominis]MCT2083216.1 hypothetical protein [Dermabacter hominis]MCT2091388.1 hypothetical protein [Dermabacter hominis]MCT2190083.1 hypothetical protein [Dermabacter hominis]MCT2226291.1 hypothetical protein [Dermabacter hominis]
MNAFALGADTAWMLVAAGVLSLVALAHPWFWIARGKAGVDDRAPRIGTLVTAASHSALWGGLGAGILVALAPGDAGDRVLRGGSVFFGSILAVAVAALGALLVARANVDGPDPDATDEPRKPRLSAARALPGSVRGIGVGAATLMLIALIVVKHADAGPLLLLVALGLAIGGASLRSGVALSSLGETGARIDVGTLEQSRDRDDLPLEPLSPPLARGPLRAVDSAALAALLAGAVMTLGAPIVGLAGLVSAIVLACGALVALIGSAFVPAGSTRSSRFVSAGLTGIIPLALVGSVLSLWLPTRYANLRMAEVGLGNFNDPLLVSLFVNSDTQQAPASVARDEVEPLIEKIAAQFSDFYANVGDAPEAQSVADTIMLHAINPSFVTGLALVIGGALALLAGLAIVWPHVRTETAMGAGPSRGIVAARFGRISPSSVGLGSSRALALLAIAALLGIAAAWGLATAAAGIAYLGYYLLALAAAGAAAVWGGFSAIAGTTDEPRGADESVASVGLSSSGRSRPTAKRSDATPARTHADSSAEHSSHEALAGAVLALLSSVAALPLVAPIAGAMRAAPQQGALWADRQLRALSVDSPTVVLGFAFGVVAVLAVVAFIATPTRAVLANAVTEARIALAEQSSARSSSDGSDDCGDEMLFEGLESALRRTSAIVVMCALLAPAVCGFGIGAASLPAFAVGVLVASGCAASVAFARVASSEAALARVESGVAGGTASLAYSSVLTEVSEARARVALTSSLAGASGFGAIAVLMTLAAAPAVVSLTGDEGTHPLVRVIIVVAALMVLVVPIVLSRGLEQVDLADNLREANDSADRESRASSTSRGKVPNAQTQLKKRAAQSKRKSDRLEENLPESSDLVDDIFGESEVSKKKRGRKRK